jgi:hypothetical protein
MKQSSVVRSSQRKKSRANGFGFVSSAQFELDQTEARERRRAQVEADVTRIAESEEQVETIERAATLLRKQQSNGPQQGDMSRSMFVM